MIDALEDDKRVEIASDIAYLYKLDPVDVLDADYFTWSVRLAARNITVEKLNKQQAEEKAKIKK